MRVVLLLLAAVPCPFHARLHSRGAILDSASLYGASIKGASVSPAVQEVIRKQGDVRARLTAERDEALSALQASEAAGKAARSEVANLQRQLEVQGRLLQEMRQELQTEHDGGAASKEVQQTTSVSDAKVAEDVRAPTRAIASSERLVPSFKGTHRQFAQDNKDIEGASTRDRADAGNAEVTEVGAQLASPKVQAKLSAPVEDADIQGSSNRDGLRVAEAELEASTQVGDVEPKDGELEALTGAVKATKSELKALDAASLQRPIEEPARRAASPSRENSRLARELSAAVDAELQKHRDAEDLRRAAASTPEAATAATEVAAAAAAPPAGAPPAAAAVETSDVLAETRLAQASADDLTMVALAGGPEVGSVEATVVGLDVDPLPPPAEADAASQ